AGTVTGSAQLDWRGAEPVVALRDIALVVRDARLGEGDGIAAVSVDAAGSVELRPDRTTASGRAALEGTIAAELEAEIADGGRASVSLRAARAGERSRDVELELRDVPAAVLAPHAKRLTGRTIAHGAVDAELELEQRDGRLAGTAAVRGLDLEL